MTAPGTRIARRKPSQLAAWRQAQYDNATDPGAKLTAAWDNLLRPALKAIKGDPARAGDLARQATRALTACQTAMDAALPVTADEARRRATQRKQYQAAGTGWHRMAAMRDWVRSSAKALGSTRHITADEHARRAGERDRLLTACAAALADIASHARTNGGDLT